jgi:uncharacterized damage-inducible protein DinB
MFNPSQAIEQYLDGGQAVRRAVAGMSREQLTARPVQGRWSTLEVVCHLADSDQAWIHRLKRVIAEDNPLLVGYDESRFAATLNYHDRDVEDELKLLELSRQEMTRILRGLPSTAYSRTGIHTERGKITLAEMVLIEIDHIAHHLKFVHEKRRALGLPEAAA